MKKAKMLNNAELASFCGELALLLPAGITPYDAILCMHLHQSDLCGFTARRGRYQGAHDYHDVLLHPLPADLSVYNR